MSLIIMDIKCEITFPEVIVKTLGYKENEVNQEIKKELAIHFFEKNLLSFGQTRKLSVLTICDFIDALF